MGTGVPMIVFGWIILQEVLSRFINTFGSRAVVLGMHSNNGEELAGGLMRERGQTEEDIAERLALYRQEICMNRDLIPDHNYYVSQGHPREIYTSIVQAVQRQGARAVSAAAIY